MRGFSTMSLFRAFPFLAASFLLAPAASVQAQTVPPSTRPPQPCRPRSRSHANRLEVNRPRAAAPCGRGTHELESPRTAAPFCACSSEARTGPARPTKPVRNSSFAAAPSSVVLASSLEAQQADSHQV
jgi:hypothetical protein